jgi:hypothetical protein
MLCMVLFSPLGGVFVFYSLEWLFVFVICYVNVCSLGALLSFLNSYMYRGRSGTK